MDAAAGPARALGRLSFTCRVPQVGGRQFTTSLLARYKMGLAKKTHVTTQYPPAA